MASFQAESGSEAMACVAACERSPGYIHGFAQGAAALGSVPRFAHPVNTALADRFIDDGLLFRPQVFPAEDEGQCGFALCKIVTDIFPSVSASAM